MTKRDGADGSALSAANENLMLNAVQDGNQCSQPQKTGCEDEKLLDSAIERKIMQNSGRKSPAMVAGVGQMGWLVAKESQIPFTHYAEIVMSVKSTMPDDFVGSKTAIVAADEFHAAQFEMYAAEASVLPFEVRVFQSRDEAVAWIRTPE
jgi:hypothetical protein